jgi:hypothetical protein
MTFARATRALFIAGTVIALGVLAASASADAEHCPDHEGNPGKVEGEANALTLVAGVEVCVKAGPGASGIVTADGATPLIDYVTWTVGSGNTPDVSYYVVYGVPTPEPTPAPTPEATPPDVIEDEPDPLPTPTVPTKPTEPTLVSDPVVLSLEWCDRDGNLRAETYEDGVLVASSITDGACATVAPPAAPEVVLPAASPAPERTEAPRPADTGHGYTPDEQAAQKRFGLALGALSLALLTVGRWAARKRGA